MIVFDEDRMVARIMSAIRTDRAEATVLMTNLKHLDSRLQEPVDQWLAGGDAQSFAYEGVNLGAIMFYFQTHFVGALHSMNRLMDGTIDLETYKQHVTGPLFVDD